MGHHASVAARASEAGTLSLSDGLAGRPDADQLQELAEEAAAAAGALPRSLLRAVLAGAPSAAVPAVVVLQTKVLAESNRLRTP